VGGCRRVEEQPWQLATTIAIAEQLAGELDVKGFRRSRGGAEKFEQAAPALLLD